MLLRIGITHGEVKKLQRALVTIYPDSKLPDTGYFGQQTLDIVKRFQKDNGLDVDGIVGNATKNLLYKDVKVNNRKKTELDYESVGKELGCDPNLIRAITTIESANSGFDSNGNMKMLFERHIFRRQLMLRGLDKLVEMLDKEYPDLCNVKYGGYKGGIHEVNKLNLAARLHEEVAYEAASYGLIQILGMNYKGVSTKEHTFNSAKQMYDYMMLDENNHLKIFTAFVKSNKKLHQAFKDKDFLNIAIQYNGPAQNGYDKLIEKHYNSFK